MDDNYEYSRVTLVDDDDIEIWSLDGDFTTECVVGLILAGYACMERIPRKTWRFVTYDYHGCVYDDDQGSSIMERSGMILTSIPPLDDFNNERRSISPYVHGKQPSDRQYVWIKVSDYMLIQFDTPEFFKGATIMLNKFNVQHSEVFFSANLSSTN